MGRACVLPGRPTGARPRSVPSGPTWQALTLPPPIISPVPLSELDQSHWAWPRHSHPPGGAGQESCSALELCLHPSPAAAAHCIFICSLQLSRVPPDSETPQGLRQEGVCPLALRGRLPEGGPSRPLAVCSPPPAPVHPAG